MKRGGFLQESRKLLHGHAGLVDDTSQRASTDVAGMQRDRDFTGGIACVDKPTMAARCSGNDKTGPLQSAEIANIGAGFGTVTIGRANMTGSIHVNSGIVLSSDTILPSTRPKTNWSPRARTTWCSSRRRSNGSILR